MPDTYRRAYKEPSMSVRSELSDTFACTLSTENIDRKRTSDAAVEIRVIASAELRDKFSIVKSYLKQGAIL